MFLPLRWGFQTTTRWCFQTNDTSAVLLTWSAKLLTRQCQYNGQVMYPFFMHFFHAFHAAHEMKHVHLARHCRAIHPHTFITCTPRSRACLYLVSTWRFCSTSCCSRRLASSSSHSSCRRRSHGAISCRRRGHGVISRPAKEPAQRRQAKPIWRYRPPQLFYLISFSVVLFGAPWGRLSAP